MSMTHGQTDNMSDALISEVILPKTRAQLQFQVDIKLEKQLRNFHSHMARLDSGTTDLRFAFPLPQLNLAANPCIYHVKREIINSSPKRRATLFGIIYLECFLVDLSLFVPIKAEINTLWKLLKFTILSFICFQLRQRYL